jgi:crotonobetainyl-CoA:carnitine CoA-transferase CaiB-like acyl-CoA transferase
LIEILQARFETASTEEWATRCAEAGILANPVNDCGDWLKDPQVEATNAFDMLSQPGVGDVPVPRLPGGLPFSGVSPGIGADTRAVLADHGYREDEVEALFGAGVVAEGVVAEGVTV